MDRAVASGVETHSGSSSSSERSWVVARHRRRSNSPQGTRESRGVAPVGREEYPGEIICFNKI